MKTSPTNQKRNRSALPLFVCPFRPTCFPSQREFKTSVRTSRDRVRLYRTAKICCNARKGWKSNSSSALHQEDWANRYVDLRSMKVVPQSQAHVCPGAAPDATFGILDDPELLYNVNKGTKLRESFFTEDTLQLSDAQKQVVQALLSRRSAIYASTAGEERIGIFMDIAMRNRVWKECVVYCASSRRSAEAMYATLCAQLGSERRSEVLLDLEEGSVETLERGISSIDARVIITAPAVLKRNLVNCDKGGWISDVRVVFTENFSMSNLMDWEEILLALPSRILMCMFMKELSFYERELLPLWLETIQNNFVLVSPTGASSLLDRIERPANFPLLRTFAYNAALHKSPVQVSLTLLKEMLQKERDSVGHDFVPNYAECFLHGVTTIPADDPSSLEFRSVEEAEYADISSLVVADAKRIATKVRTKTRKRSRAPKRKERTASSRAAARRRRDAAYEDSLLLPAIALVNGQKEAENAAFAIQSALGDETSLLWDDDSREHVEDIIGSFREAHSDDMSDADIDILHALKDGIGIVHDGCVPSVRLLAEELFRGGLIPVIVVDTHLGSKELLALPCAKSVLVESSALALCDDEGKGLVKSATVAALAGRMGKDDVGNLVVLWYDEAIDDEAAGSEISLTLMYPFFSDIPSGLIDGLSMFTKSEETSPAYQEQNDDERPRNRGSCSTPLSSSYDGILRSLRRFGVDGYESILDYTIQTFRGWLERAALHATQEKLSFEKKAMDDILEKQDWSAIAEFDRKASKKNEAARVLKAMEKRYASVVAQGVQEELQIASAGRVIGVECSKNKSSPWEQRLLKGTSTSSEEPSSKDSSRPATGQQEVTDERSLGETKDTLSTAVFVAVRDQESDGNHIKSIESRWLVVCVLADGAWTMVPMSDVVAISSEEDDIIPIPDLLIPPHSATFDVDPTHGWAKCFPADDSENTAVQKISDELISLVASTNPPTLERYKIPEFEAQRDRAERAEKVYRQSAWHGREAELSELRRLRRRSAEIGDEIEALRKKEMRVEDNLFDRHSKETSNQSSILAVLEDCHALSILGDGSMELTPIGALGSILPGKYPLFSAACLSLIDDAELLSPGEFAAFVAAIICSERIWSMNDLSLDMESRRKGGSDDAADEELDMSILQQLSGRNEEEPPRTTDRKMTAVEGLERVLPPQIVLLINDILSALQQLHERHQSERSQTSVTAVSDIVPSMLNIRIAKAVKMFVMGESWRDICGVVNQESGYAVREMRVVKGVLETISDADAEGEFSDQARQVARQAFEGMNRWPVRDEEAILSLVEEGVVERVWNGNTYDKWWRRVRDQLSEFTTKGEEIESVEAEILES